jgi:hypothetical protein
MKVYKLEIMVIDTDNCGAEEIKDMIENARYPNHAINPKVMQNDSVDIGEWHDNHPLNYRSSQQDTFKALFAK